MATVTVTETGVTLVVQMVREEGGDSIRVTANSLTDTPEVAGRSIMDYDLAPLLSPAQAASLVSTLDFIEGLVKDYWNIP